ncbi:MAG: methyltransferase domain-containing protein [Catenulispora sp.]|nr:methyltransferase domain-containing protein [Catenulispora sp.]
MPRRTSVITVATATAAASAWWYSDRAPYPYSRRRLLDLQLPFLSNSDLDQVLRARPGERVLEIGPGTGLQTLHVAPQLGPEGRLDILDVQQEMLDHVMSQAARPEAAQIVPHRADARALPFDTDTFDAVYLVTALGEIPQPRQVLAEAARVIKPSGRLIVGEFFDRHWIPFGRLHRMADGEGLHVIERRGPSLAYFARLRPCWDRSSAC